MNVLGIERNVVIDFYDKKKQEKVHHEGLRLHLSWEQKNVEGMAVDKPLFVSKTRDCYGLAETLKVGETINVIYNKYGNFESISK